MTPSDLRKARISAGLTQTEAAALLGKQRLAWARYEAGTRSISMAEWRYWLHVAGLERIPFRKRVLAASR